MTEHKFTDEEVIRALECCSSAECEKCKYVPQGDCYQGSLACNDDLMRSALDLINRQKAEIANLINAVDNSTKEFLKLHDEYQEQKAEVAYWMDTAANAKKEAINEFAERLKKYYGNLNSNTAAVLVEYHIEQIKEEMLCEK